MAIDVAVPAFDPVHVTRQRGDGSAERLMPTL
jgi:hypothetical protein